MFGDIIFYNAQKQVTLNLGQLLGLNSNTRYNASSAYLQGLNKSEFKMTEKTLGNYISDPEIVSG